MCDMNLTEVEEEYNPITVSLIHYAKRFDMMSEMVLDGYMCTKNTCPCLKYDTPDGKPVEDLFKNDTLLMEHDRTFDANRNSFDSYMFFTTNEEKSFKNANHCFQTWRGVFNKIDKW